MHEVDTHKEKEKAILVGLSLLGERWETEDHLEELALLADTAGAKVIDKVIQVRRRIDAAYFIGRGKAQSLFDQAEETGADLVIFDDDLSPAQVRNLEKMTGKKVMDRSGLILDIFAKRAKTREAKTQVELAQLNYLLPRLTRQWSHLSRQVGGIGTKGPGETQLETDRRLVRTRIAFLTRALEKIKSQRSVRRKGREDGFKVALVGYTNAGKSTLLNTMTRSEVFVEDRLFATLDPTIRKLKVENFRDLLLIDTVGFIRKLPHNLVASFKSTLEEATVADLLLHVVDVTHPHFLEHIKVVKEVLNDLNCSTKPTLYVFNKIDALKENAIIERLKNEFSPSIFISAAKGMFVDDLQQEIVKLAASSLQQIELTLDINSNSTISKIYELTEVLETEYEETFVKIKAQAPEENIEILRSYLNKHQQDGFKFNVLK